MYLLLAVYTDFGLSFAANGEQVEQKPRYLRKALVEETEQASVKWSWISGRKTRRLYVCVHSKPGKNIVRFPRWNRW